MSGTGQARSGRLDRLIRLLSRREDAATAARAGTAGRVRDAHADVERARQARRDLAAPAPVLRPAQLQAMRLVGLGTAADIERASAALDERRTEDDEAERERSVAAVRRRSVERLAERRRTVSVRAAAAASQRALDELATLREAQQ